MKTAEELGITNRQRANYITLRDALMKFAPHKFNMREYFADALGCVLGSPPDVRNASDIIMECGSTCCALGLAASIPEINDGTHRYMKDFIRDAFDVSAWAELDTMQVKRWLSFFSEKWSERQDTPKECAARIDHWLNTGEYDETLFFGVSE